MRREFFALVVVGMLLHAEALEEQKFDVKTAAAMAAVGGITGGIVAQAGMSGGPDNSAVTTLVGTGLGAAAGAAVGYMKSKGEGGHMKVPRWLSHDDSDENKPARDKETSCEDSDDDGGKKPALKALAVARHVGIGASSFSAGKHHVPAPALVPTVGGAKQAPVTSAQEKCENDAWGRSAAAVSASPLDRLKMVAAGVITPKSTDEILKHISLYFKTEDGRHDLSNILKHLKLCGGREAVSLGDCVHLVLADTHSTHPTVDDWHKSFTDRAKHIAKRDGVMVPEPTKQEMIDSFAMQFVKNPKQLTKLLKLMHMCKVDEVAEFFKAHVPTCHGLPALAKTMSQTPALKNMRALKQLVLKLHKSDKPLSKVKDLISEAVFAQPAEVINEFLTASGYCDSGKTCAAEWGLHGKKHTLLQASQIITSKSSKKADIKDELAGWLLSHHSLTSVLKHMHICDCSRLGDKIPADPSQRTFGVLKDKVIADCLPEDAKTKLSDKLAAYVMGTKERLGEFVKSAGGDT